LNCNCVITPASTANTTAALMFVAGLVALFKGRRSRRA
jgi:MYXO-CTERM domain-containing protein